MKIMKLAGIVSFGVALIAAGCGSSGSSKSDGAAGSTGGTGGTGATGGTGSGGTASGGTSGTAACGDVPACVANLFTGCTPSGTCMTQINTTTFAFNTCYSNGVKVLVSIDGTTEASSITYVKSDGTTCFTVSSTSDSTGNTTTSTIKNAAGATVATETDITDPDGGADTVTVTCGNKTYNVTDEGNCGMGSTSNCTDGTCS